MKTFDDINRTGNPQNPESEKSFENINEKVQKYEYTLQEIIESFDLPQNTSPESIVPVLRTMFSRHPLF